MEATKTASDGHKVTDRRSEIPIKRAVQSDPKVWTGWIIFYT